MFDTRNLGLREIILVLPEFGNLCHKTVLANSVLRVMTSPPTYLIRCLACQVSPRLDSELRRSRAASAIESPHIMVPRAASQSSHSMLQEHGPQSRRMSTESPGRMVGAHGRGRMSV